MYNEGRNKFILLNEIIPVHNLSSQRMNNKEEKKELSKGWSNLSFDGARSAWENLHPTKRNTIVFWKSTSPFSNFNQTIDSEGNVQVQFIDSDNNKYTCSEQYFMSQKIHFCHNTEENKQRIDKIRTSTNPANMKKLGRALTGFDSQGWDEKGAMNAMYDACWLKYTQSKYHAKCLLSTGDDILVEASPTDRIWGIGYDEDKMWKVDVCKWGNNQLGIVLMMIRDKLRSEN